MRKFGTCQPPRTAMETDHFRLLRLGSTLASMRAVRDGRNITATPSTTRPRRRAADDGDLDRTGVFTNPAWRELATDTVEEPRGYLDWRDTPLAHPRLVPRQLIAPRAPQPTPTTALRPRRVRAELPPLTLPPSLPVEVPGSEPWSEPGIAITPTTCRLHGSEPWCEPGIAITPTTCWLRGSEPEVMWPDPPPRRDPPLCGGGAPASAEPRPRVEPSRRRPSTERTTLPPPFPLARGTAPILPASDFLDEASTGFR